MSTTGQIKGVASVETFLTGEIDQYTMESDIVSRSEICVTNAEKPIPAEGSMGVQ